jgi:acyl-CoA dehydrogenase
MNPNTYLSFSDVLEAIKSVCNIARQHADDVDKHSRFPSEAVQALKSVGAFGWPVPKVHGGLGLSAFEAAKVCYQLGQHCSATAAILSMHYTQIYSVVYHHDNQPALIGYMQKVAAENRLIASVTSEVGPGGNMRNSQCAVSIVENQYSVCKKATTISYAQYADDLMITARKDADAAVSDQVLVIAQQGQFVLSEVGEWDTLGMRGTCSPPCVVNATGEAWQVMQVPFADIATLTMVPTSHIFWSAWWLGLATEAVNKCRELLRLKAKSNPGQIPLGAHRVADLGAALQTMELEVFGMAREYTEMLASQKLKDLAGIGYTLKINALKLNSSKSLVAITSEAMSILGIQGYKNGGKFSLGRQLRDAYSAMIMVHNDRIQQTNASILTVHKGF